MTSGWNTRVRYRPMNRRYIAFSIEELSTIKLEGAVEEAHNNT